LGQATQAAGILTTKLDQKSLAITCAAQRAHITGQFPRFVARTSATLQYTAFISKNVLKWRTKMAGPRRFLLGASIAHGLLLSSRLEDRLTSIELDAAETSVYVTGFSRGALCRSLLALLALPPHFVSLTNVRVTVHPPTSA
jgi:hypothetical protein